MLKSLYTGAAGMSAQQMNVDNIAHNLSNVNTSGYKKTNMEFQDLLYQTYRAAGLQTGQQSQTPNELQIGSGVRPVATNRNFSQGSTQSTGNPLDVCIMGDGFFRIQNGEGAESYSRDGHFKISSDGTLVTNDGYIVQPQITIPQDTEAVLFGENGVVSVILAGEAVPQEIGQLELVKFMNPGGLKAAGQNLYEVTAASGDPVGGTPGSTGYGRILQGNIEASNVDLVQEMVNMITAQRAYDLNSKTIRTADDMLNTALNVKR